VLKFPKNFYWGTATSAYQVEGGIRNDWSQAGKKYDAGRACDHYNRFEEDFDLAKKMNNNVLRFSIEWARIEPEEGKFNQKEIEHYRKVILALKKRNLEPFVTLYHWTLPVWFVEKGHWLSKKSPDYFTKYVEFVVKNLSDVKFWITINEPNVYTSHSFLKGDWPPQTKSFFKTQEVLRSLIASHKKSYQIIHKISPTSKVGIAKNNTHFKGILKFFSDYYWNYQFLDAIKDYQDFIGLNYYFSRSLLSTLFPVGRKEISDLNWGISPRGIYYVLKNLKRYNKPIYITENGLADAKDEKRTNFIINHLKWIHKAIKEGVNVRGYFHWSLLDNFEWDKGFGPRFGLVEIDYKTLKRKPRSSSKIYAKICKNNALNI
jgi:beta-glucosidase